MSGTGGSGNEKGGELEPKGKHIIMSSCLKTNVCNYNYTPRSKRKQVPHALTLAHNVFTKASNEISALALHSAFRP
eukprot:5226430-Amphidinium_carterae.1